MPDPFWGHVYLGSCERMDAIPDGSVHCAVTSPPYFGLRNYGGRDEQIGAEASVGEYVDRLVAVAREVRRCLRDDGTFWLNLGDSYAAAQRGLGHADSSSISNPARQESATVQRDTRHVAPGLKPKDLIGIPWRVAFALQEDGWWLRDAIIWHKPNPMPSSVDDRCSPAYEFVFMLSKSARYFADMDAVRQPLSESSLLRMGQATIGQQHGSERGHAGDKTNGTMKSRDLSALIQIEPENQLMLEVPDSHRGVTPVNLDANAGLDDRWSWENRRRRAAAHVAKTIDGEGTPSPAGTRQAPEPGEPNAFHALGANLRNVWSIPTEAFTQTRYVCRAGHDFITDRPMKPAAEKAFRCQHPVDLAIPFGLTQARVCGLLVESDSHFAVFPPDLPARCIRIGTSEAGCCEACGAPRVRLIEREVGDQRGSAPDADYAAASGEHSRSRAPTTFYAQATSTTRWTAGFEPSCACDAPTVPCVVLDPFMGSGTVAEVAEGLGRRWVGVELNPAYHPMIAERTKQVGLFSS